MRHVQPPDHEPVTDLTNLQSMPPTLETTSTRPHSKPKSSPRAPATIYTRSAAQTVLRRGSRGISPCLVSQMDGIIFSIFGAGARISFDATSPGGSIGLCSQSHRGNHESLSTGVGLYIGDHHQSPHLVAAAAASRACGLFIVNVRPGAPPLMAKTPSDTGVPWYDFLLDGAMAVFHLPAAAVPILSPRGGVVGVLRQFGRNGAFRHKSPRQYGPPELTAPAASGPRSFHLELTNGYPDRLGVVPRLWTRASPQKDQFMPTGDSDLAEGRAPFPGFTGTGPPPAVPEPPDPKWNVDLVLAEASDYPDVQVFDTAVEVMSGSFDPFVGSRTKAVEHPSRHRLNQPQYQLAKDILDKDVAKGISWGPLPFCPFPFARTYSFSLVPKHKYVANCDEFRLCSNISVGRPYSTNDLTQGPRLISVHFSVPLFMDICISMGKGLKVTHGDCKSAFKMNPNNTALLGLFVTFIENEAGFREFYGDLCNVFGWTGAEYGWQCELALTTWMAHKRGIDNVYFYVDNYWVFHPAGSDVAAKVELVDKFLVSLGWTLHEQYTAGTHPKILGWSADLSCKNRARELRLVLPKDKYDSMLPKFKAWAAAKVLSLEDIRSATGLAQFLSRGCRSGAPYVAHLQHMQNSLESAMVRAEEQQGTTVAPSAVVHAKSKEASMALRFWHQRLSGWDRMCPMVQGFGPSAGAQAFGFADASPPDVGNLPHGCGGVLFLPDAPKGQRLFIFAVAWAPRDVHAVTAHPGSKSSSAAYESIGFRIWLQKFGHRCTKLRVLLAGDSEAAMLAHQKAFSDKSKLMSDSVFTSRMLAARHSLCLRVRALQRTFPPLLLADYLSHSAQSTAGSLPFRHKALCLAEEIFGERPRWV